MDNKSWQEEYAKLTRPFYKEWYFGPLMLLIFLALIFCGKAYQIYAADAAAAERESNVTYHSTAESSVGAYEIYSSEETSSESHSEESLSEGISESKESSTPNESSIEEASEVITPPPKPPQKIPAPENITFENSVYEESSIEDSSSESVSEEIPESSGELSTIDCGEKYIVNINTGKFHRRSCSSVTQMKSSNKRYCNIREVVIDHGYVPCKRCDP